MLTSLEREDAKPVPFQRAEGKGQRAEGKKVQRAKGKGQRGRGGRGQLSG